MKLSLFKILLPVLVMLAGCGSQDRYEVMDPPGGLVIEESNWGQITKLETVHNRLSPGPATVIGNDHYFGSVDGMIYRPVGTGYEVQPRPEDLNVAALLQGPDDLLWMADPGGRILYFENGQWILDNDLNLSAESNTNLLLDHEGRILLFGGEGRLWRRDLSGQWTNQDIPDETNLVHGWCDYGQAPVFLTENFQLVAEGAQGWDISEPLMESDLKAYEIQCSELGYKVVRYQDNNDFLLNMGDGWQIVTSSQRMIHMFWLGNELFGTRTYNGNLHKWDGSSWNEFLPLNGGPRRVYCWSSPSESGRYLYFDYGETWFFDGENLTEITPRLTWPVDFVRHEGTDHIYTRFGKHLQLQDGVWEDHGYPIEGVVSSSSDFRMVVDDRDELVFFSVQGIAQWNGETYHLNPFNVWGLSIFLQTDGKVVFFSDHKIGVWTQGQVRWSGYFEESIYNVYGARWESDDRVVMLLRGNLSLVEPHQTTITFTFQGWTPSQMAGGQGQVLACSGPGRVIEVDGLSVKDITPRWESSDGVSADLSTLIADGYGGWLAFDYERHSLLRFDGQKWLDMRGDFGGPGNYYRRLNSNRDGTFILKYFESVYLVEPEVAP